LTAARVISSFPASTNLDIGASASGITIEGWINPSKADAQGPMAEWDSASDDGLQFWVEPPLQLFANIKDTTGTPHALTSDGNLVATNTWQHVALTYNKTNGATVIYLNGNSVVNANFGTITPQTTSRPEHRPPHRPADRLRPDVFRRHR
jgi:hypothetical protein